MCVNSRTRSAAGAICASTSTCAVKVLPLTGSESETAVTGWLATNFATAVMLLGALSVVFYAANITALPSICACARLTLRVPVLEKRNDSLPAAGALIAVSTSYFLGS